MATSSGVLLSSPIAPRINSTQSGMNSLTKEQRELVNKAKKYALEQTLKSMLPKQTVTSNQQQPQRSIQRHQALVLMCRVYVGSISFELREETVKAAFAPYGAIKSINMSWDPVTLKHKGFAFVEYELPEAAQLALEHMNGLQLGGRQIKVGRPSNMPQAAPIIQQIQEECKEKNRIYVSNVHPDLSETELGELFEPFGKVLTCKLAQAVNVEKPEHRGYGFVEFETEAAATEALTMNNLDLGGQVLHVCQATTPSENVSVNGTLETESSSSQAASLSSSAPMLTSDEELQLQLARATREQNSEIYMDAEALKFEATLIQRDQLLRQQQQQQQETENSTNIVTNDKVGDLSNILVLRNMVSAEDEIDDTLQLDVFGECRKHGEISQVVTHVDKKPLKTTTSNGADELDTSNQDEVRIFVKYTNSTSSQKAREALNGRFFAGRKVSAEHYDTNLFKFSNYSG